MRAEAGRLEELRSSKSVLSVDFLDGLVLRNTRLRGNQGRWQSTASVRWCVCTKAIRRASASRIFGRHEVRRKSNTAGGSGQCAIACVRGRGQSGVISRRQSKASGSTHHLPAAGSVAGGEGCTIACAERQAGCPGPRGSCACHAPAESRYSLCCCCCSGEVSSSLPAVQVASP